MRKFLIRSAVIFVPPIIFVILLQNIFSIEKSFPVDQNKIDQIRDIQPLISDALLEQEKHLEFLIPIINIDPKWFLYSVDVENNVKSVVDAKGASPSYVEYKAELILITDRENSIPYGEKRRVFSSTEREDIFKNFDSYTFKSDMTVNQIVLPPNTQIIFYPLGEANFQVYLSWLSVMQIYVLLLIVWVGLLVLIKSIFQFIYFGKNWWLK